MNFRSRSRVVRSALAWTAAGLLAACGGSGGGSATPATPPSLAIFFSGDSDGDHEIYGLDPATGAVVPLTSNSAYDDDPSASGDGSRIAFVSDRASPLDVFVMNADGTGQTRLTGATSLGTACMQPAISRDGTRIAYSSPAGIGNTDIYVMDGDGTNVTRLTTATGTDHAPCFNDDGTRIVFASNRISADNPNGFSRIWVMNADGSNQVRLTNVVGNFGDSHPSFNGIGNLIAFESSRDGANEIYVMNADGTGLVRLTSDASADYSPSFGVGSLDVLFTTDRFGGGDEIASVPVGGGADRPGENTEPAAGFTAVM